jgi:hypothetical protein
VSAAAANPGTGLLRAALAILAAAAALSSSAPRASAQDDRKKQEIVFSELPARTVDDGPFDIAAKASSGLPVTLELVSGPAKLDGRTITLSGIPGLVIIRATQGGNAAFLPAVQAERAFSVNARPSAPAIVVQPMAARASIGEIIALSVKASGEPAPTLQWRKDGMPVTGATEARFTIASAAPTDAGAYDVVASNLLGSATSERAVVTVGRRTQSISFEGPTNGTSGQPIQLSANASSGLPVRFDVISGTAVLNGSSMTSTGGTVVIQATQPGDATYDAAAPVTRTFVIGPGPNGQRGP